MNKQQTAVEWLIDNLKGQLNIDEVTYIIKQGKEMEKQQIIDAFKHGELPPLFVNFDAEQYYDNMFKTKL
jgi:hypothetical protein